MSAALWQETYRGVVYRWEVDHNDHLTVAYYFQRLGDATRALLDGLGLTPPGDGPEWTTIECHVRYQQELRVGDVMHVDSAPIAIDSHEFVAGHRMINSETGSVVTTFEQRLRRLGADGLAAPLAVAQRERLEGARAAWDGPPRERRSRPKSVDGLRDSARDTIRPAEVDVDGRAGLAAYVHRFSAANSHAIAAFGMTPSYMREQRRGFSTFEFQLSAAGTLRAGDGVVVRSGVLHVGTTSLRLFHVMCDPRTGAEVAQLHQLGVHLDMDVRRPAPLPPELAHRARALRLAADD